MICELRLPTGLELVGRQSFLRQYNGLISRNTGTTKGKERVKKKKGILEMGDRIDELKKKRAEIDAEIRRLKTAIAHGE